MRRGSADLDAGLANGPRSPRRSMSPEVARRKYGPNGVAVAQLIGQLTSPGVPWFVNVGTLYPLEVSVERVSTWEQAWSAVAADRGWIAHLRQPRSILDAVAGEDSQHVLSMAWHKALLEAHAATREGIGVTGVPVHEDAIGKTAAHAGRAALELVLGHLPGVPSRALACIPWLMAGHFVCGYDPKGRLVIF